MPCILGELWLCVSVEHNEIARLSMTPNAVEFGKPVRISCSTPFSTDSIVEVLLQRRINVWIDQELVQLVKPDGMQTLYLKSGVLPKGMTAHRIDLPGGLGVEVLINATTWTDDRNYSCTIQYGQPRLESRLSSHLPIYRMLLYIFFHAPLISAFWGPGGVHASTL